MAMMFTIITALGNIAKHFRDFNVLMVGSILEGISASLLFTVFDSWLVRSHSCSVPAKIPSSAMAMSPSTQTPTLTPTPIPSLWLSRVFATAEYRNNIVAIGASLVSGMMTDATVFQPLAIAKQQDESNAVFYVGGVLNPFDLSTFALLLCGILIGVSWDENLTKEAEQKIEKVSKKFGTSVNSSETGTPSPWWRRYRSLLVDVSGEIITSREIWLCGIVCFLFESAMFIFVFSWTNAIAPITNEQDEIPFGLIFATFMFGCMTGTSVFTVLIDEMKVRNETIGEGLLLVATCTFIAMAFAKSIASTIFFFFLFEVSVGIYFPMMATMKSEIVPDCHRTTICNSYRIPFNLVMISFLSVSDYLSVYPELSFVICACMTGAAFFFQVKLGKHRKQKPLSRRSTLHETAFRDEGRQQKKIS